MKKKPARKTVSMLVTVTGPAWMTKSEIRREVRWMVKGQSGYLDCGPDFQEVNIALKQVKAA